MPDLIEISCSRLLLVEGQDEENVLGTLFKVRGITDVQVLKMGGKDQLRPRMKAIRQTPGFDNVTWLGVVQDADTDARAACDRIRGALGAAGLPVPWKCWKPVVGDPTVVACVLPGNEEAGDLELLVKHSVASQPVASCVDAYLQCCGYPTSGKFWKAWIHVYLASLDPPDLRLGLAAQKRLLDFTHPIFDDLVSLIP